MAEVLFAYPATLEEAVALLGDPEAGAVPVGGGTALAEESGRDARLYVDISRCGIDSIEQTDEELRIGAGVRVADINGETLSGGPESQLLVEAAQGIASQPLRNAITLGGNMVHLCRWADMPVALLALDATVQVSHAGKGAFEMPIGKLVEQHPRKTLPKGALVTGVRVPLAGGTRGATYQRFRTTLFDYPLLAVAVVVDVESNDTCSAAAISVGSLSPRPSRATQAEQLLTAGSILPERVAEAAAKIGELAAVAPNFRMSEETRRRILIPVARRAITTAFQRAGVRSLS